MKLYARASSFFSVINSYALVRTNAALGRSFCLNEVVDFHKPSLSRYRLSKETLRYSMGWPSLLVPAFFQTVAMTAPVENFFSGALGFCAPGMFRICCICCFACMVVHLVAIRFLFQPRKKKRSSPFWPPVCKGVRSCHVDTIASIAPHQDIDCACMSIGHRNPIINYFVVLEYQN